MRRTLVVARKELAATLGSPMGLVVLVAFSAFATYATTSSVLASGQASLRFFFEKLPLAFLFALPAVSMRLLAEERKLGTLELLLTWPLDELEVIAGKHLGALGFAGVLTTFALVPCYAFTAWLGDVDGGPVLAGLVGALLLAAAYLAIGVFASSLTENQVVAFVLTVVLIAPLWLIGIDEVRRALPVGWLPLADAVSLSRRFEPFARGVVDVRDVAYFFALVACFLALTARVLGARRWSGARNAVDALTASILTLAIAATVVRAFDDHPARRDLTRERVHSLAPAARAVVASLEDPCEVVGYFSQGLPAEMVDRRRRTVDLLSEVEAASLGRIRFSERNPSDAGVAAECSRIGIARTTVTTRSRSQVQAMEIYFGLALLYRDRRQVIPFVGDPRELEHDLAAAIRALDVPRAKTAAVHVPRAPAQPTAAQRLLIDRLKLRHFDVSHVHPGEPVPPNVSLVVLCEPRALSDRDAFEVDQAVMRGAGLLVLAGTLEVDRGLTAHARPTGLEDLLEAWGVGLGRGLVREQDPERDETIRVLVGNKPVEGPFPFAPRFPRDALADHPIRGAITELSIPYASPVSVSSGTALVRASERADVRPHEGNLWAETERFMGAVAKKSVPPVERAGPPPVVAAAVRGPLASAWKGRPVPRETHLLAEGMGGLSDDVPETRDPLVEAKDARVVVIGSAALIDPDQVYFQVNRAKLERNVAFVLNAVDWLTDETELIPLRGRDLVERRIRAVEEASVSRARLLAYGWSGLVLLAGVFLVQRTIRRRTSAPARLREALGQ